MCQEGLARFPKGSGPLGGDGSLEALLSTTPTTLMCDSPDISLSVPHHPAGRSE